MEKKTQECNYCGFEATNPKCKPGWMGFNINSGFMSTYNESNPGMAAWKELPEGRMDFCSISCLFQWIEKILTGGDKEIKATLRRVVDDVHIDASKRRRTMKISDLIKAQKRYDELTEEIEAVWGWRNDMREIIIRSHTDVGLEILVKCRDKLIEKRDELIKERHDLEV